MAGEEETPRALTDEPGPTVTARGDGLPRPGREPIWITLLVLAIIAAFIIAVRRILAPFIVAGVLAYIADPAVHWVQKRTRLPRPAAVALFFLIFMVPIGALIYLLEPILVQETKELATNAPAILANLLSQIFGGNSVEVLGQTLDATTVSDFLLRSTRNLLGTPAEAIHFASAIMAVLLDAFLSVVLLFYFLLSPVPVGQVALRLIPAEYRPHWRRVGQEINAVMGHYVRGLFFLVCLMTAVTWTGLTAIFHLPFALPIALVTGFLEIIPLLGPVIAATIAAVVGLFYGGTGYAAGIVIFYFVIRELEDQLVMPLVIGRAVEIPPVLAIFAVLAGQAIGGVLGALLGIPVAAAVKIGFDRWRPPTDS